jgi:hypothetical protein
MGSFKWPITPTIWDKTRMAGTAIEITRSSRVASGSASGGTSRRLTQPTPRAHWRTLHPGYNGFSRDKPLPSPFNERFNRTRLQRHYRQRQFAPGERATDARHSARGPGNQRYILDKVLMAYGLVRLAPAWTRSPLLLITCWRQAPRIVPLQCVAVCPSS